MLFRLTTLALVLLLSLGLLLSLSLLTRSTVAESAADYFNSGRAKASKGDMNGAIADYTRAIEINPELVMVYATRGMAKHVNGDQIGAFAVR